MQPAPDFKKQAIGTIAGVSAKADSMRGVVSRAAHETRPTLTELAQKVKSNPEFAKKIRQMAQRHAKLMNDIATANSTPVALVKPMAAKPAIAPDQRKVAGPAPTHGTGHGARGTSPGWQRIHKPKGPGGPS